MAGFTAWLAIILLIAAFYGWLTGMWKAHGGGFHGSLGPLAMALATIAVCAALLDAVGVGVAGTLPSASGIAFLPVIKEALPYIVFYLAFTRLPWNHHVFLTTALFDRLIDGTGLWEGYRRKRAGEAMEDILGQRGIGRYR